MQANRYPFRTACGDMKIAGNIVADSQPPAIAEPAVGGVQASPVVATIASSPRLVVSPSNGVSLSRQVGNSLSRQVGNLSYRAVGQAHDAVLQSLSTPATVAEKEAVALWDLDSSWSSRQSDRKHDSIDGTVDAVIRGGGADVNVMKVLFVAASEEPEGLRATVQLLQEVRGRSSGAQESILLTTSGSNERWMAGGGVERCQTSHPPAAIRHFFRTLLYFAPGLK